MPPGSVFPLSGATISLSFQTTDQSFMGPSGGGGDPLDPPARPTAVNPVIFTPADGVAYRSGNATCTRREQCDMLPRDADRYLTQWPGDSAAERIHSRPTVWNQLSTGGPACRLCGQMHLTISAAFWPMQKKQVPDEGRHLVHSPDIEPLLVQYGNLYPIMGKYVVDLRDYGSVVSRVKVLRLAFSLPVEDPNHMPVTRDMGNRRPGDDFEVASDTEGARRPAAAGTAAG